MLKMESVWFFKQIYFYCNIGNKLCELFIQDQAFQKFLNANEQNFDIIIISDFLYDCVFSISCMLDMPVINTFPFGGTKWMDE